LYCPNWLGDAPSGHTPLCFEIHANYGLFARPDVSISVATSYPVPTWSAAKGMIERIFWRYGAWKINPLGVEVLGPIEFTDYAFNYAGELRKSDAIARGVNALFKFQILVNPHYRIIFDVENGVRDVGEFLSRFSERLSTGDHASLCMGSSDFMAFAEPASGREIFAGFSWHSPLMLKTPHGMDHRTIYFRDVLLSSGRLIYPFDREVVC
jgi:CRISPR-associated Cas5-like protein